MPGAVAPVRDALCAAEDALRAAGCDTPRLDAELLIAHALGVEREALFLSPDCGVPPAAARRAMELAAQQAELSAERAAQVGTGARAEKIRTYNFPQDRVTDHRVKLTRGNIPGVLAGELDEFTAALEADEKRRKLEAGSLAVG